MKYSVAAIAAMATVAVAKPSFTDTSFPDLKEGATVTLGFSDCESKCTIILQTGSSTNLKDVKTLTTDATGKDAEVTLPSKLPSGDYAFLIKDNGETDSSEWNYSQQFGVKGTGSASSSDSETSATKTDDSSSTTEASSTATETESKTESETSATGTEASKTHKSTASSTKETTAPSTSAPNPNNAGSLSSRLSPIALIAGGAAAMLFLS